MLHLTATGHTASDKRLLVSTQILAVASPVWKKLLRGDMAEATAILAGERPKIEFPDDHADAMEVILCALHHCDELIPKPVSLCLLAQVAILSDKYDCPRASAPG